MDSKILFPLLYAISVLFFNIINWYGAKNTSSLISTIKYAFLTLPIQLVAYVLLVQGFNIGYKIYENFYSIIIISVTISWIMKIITAYGFDKKIPTLGQIIALALLIIANFIQKIIK